MLGPVRQTAPRCIEQLIRRHQVSVSLLPKVVFTFTEHLDLQLVSQ